MGSIDKCVALASLLLATASSASVQDNDIIVHGRTGNRLHALVKVLTPVNYGHQVGRWRNQICLQIIGVKPDYASLIKGQILAEITRLRLQVSHDPLCRANLVVAATLDADGDTRNLYKTDPWLYGDPKDGNPLPQHVEALLRPQPIRWFVANRTVPSPGIPTMPSRIRLFSHEETVFAYVLLDANKLAGATWRQLGDYVAFVALAGPEPGADFDESSILSLFSEREAGRNGPPALTAQDLQFLDALYESDPNLPAGQQRSEIERRIETDTRRKPHAADH